MIPTNKSEERDKLRENITTELLAYAHKYGSHTDYQHPSASEYHVNRLMALIDQYTAGEKVEADRLARIDELESLINQMNAGVEFQNQPPEYLKPWNLKILHRLDELKQSEAELAPHKETDR